MVLPQKKTCSIEDINNLPENQRAELIDGQIYMQAAPNRLHQYIVMELSYRIKDYIIKNNGPCQVYPAPFAVYLNGDETEYFEPDISVICDPNKLDSRGCKGAPDIIIEVTSPSSSGRDYLLKSAKYQAAGVREYWIVNPQKQIVTIYNFSKEEFAPQNATFNDKIKVNIYEDLYIDFSQIEFPFS